MKTINSTFRSGKKSSSVADSGKIISLLLILRVCPTIDRSGQGRLYDTVLASVGIAYWVETLVRRGRTDSELPAVGAGLYAVIGTGFWRRTDSVNPVWWLSVPRGTVGKRRWGNSGFTGLLKRTASPKSGIHRQLPAVRGVGVPSWFIVLLCAAVHRRFRHSKGLPQKSGNFIEVSSPYVLRETGETRARRHQLTARSRAHVK